MTNHVNDATALKLKVLPHGAGLPLPEYATPHAAGLDLCAAVESPLRLESLERAAVPTGLQLEIPEGYEGQVRARSGRALREGLALVNAPGTIDADYRGEVKVILVNLGREPIVIARGDRIAQLVIAPIVRVTVNVIADLAATQRGDGGFGSTGR